MPTAAEWDERYGKGEHATSKPDPFLVQCAPYFEEFLPKRGTALDLAGGAGRNAVYLAGLGFDVTLVDFSTVALRKAERLAQKRGVSIHTVAADLESGEYVPSSASFDLVVVFFYLERALFPAIRAALKSGGLVVYRTYTVDQPKHQRYLLRHNELLDAFRGFRVLRYEEIVKGKGVAGLLALKTPSAIKRRRR